MKIWVFTESRGAFLERILSRLYLYPEPKEDTSSMASENRHSWEVKQTSFTAEWRRQIPLEVSFNPIFGSTGKKCVCRFSVLKYFFGNLFSMLYPFPLNEVSAVSFLFPPHFIKLS